MKYLLTIVLLFTFSQVVVAAFYSGNEMLKMCEAYLSETGSAADGNICVGYVVGIHDGHFTFSVRADMKKTICLPDSSVDGSQLVRVVTKHLQEHPEDLHYTAASLITNALQQAFPCE